ncbi:MAG: hypothetical protein GX803_05705 [Lentisphaerae bacterium]|jgi:hypothetical protein|nr:hypothetical protein [Lentisphaerota bacterium]
MTADNELKPLDISQVKSSTSRIDLSKAMPPSSPSPAGIRIGSHAKKATSRIDISAIPGAAKAQTSQVGLGAMPAMDDDIYKRRTTLLDTSQVPLSGAPKTQPRTIRIGARPTVRISSSGAPVTSAPGEEGAAISGRPTIRLKRPGGGASITVPSTGGVSLETEPIFAIQEDEGPGAIWAVVSLLSFLALIGLMAIQIITMNGAAY